MTGIALDLGRAPLMALYQHAAREAAEDIGTREVEWFAGNEILRLFNVGDKPFDRLSTA